MKLSENAINWLANGQRGKSSETIFWQLTGIDCRQGAGSHPYDPDDFQRCEKLLRDVPEFRSDMEKMRKVSPIWNELVEHWEEITELMLDEVPQVFDCSYCYGKAPLTYEMMKQLGC